MLSHSGRILFGTDEIPPSRPAYEVYLRFMESPTSASPILPRTRRRPGAGTSRPWTCRRESRGRFMPTTPGG